MILHNLKVAVRNLMKYKLQTIISVLSIAIGIVTLAFTHSILENAKLPPITSEPYYDRIYALQLESDDPGNWKNRTMTFDMIRALKANGGLRSAEKMVFSCNMMMGMLVEFHLPDSTIRKGADNAGIIDPDYPHYAGLRSAITGKRIKRLKAGEAIVSEEHSKKLFKDKNPVGTVQTLTSDINHIPLTIVDVYKNLPLTSRDVGNDALYYSPADDVAEFDNNTYFPSDKAEFVLKEGKRKNQLQKEIEERLKPWDAKIQLTKISENGDYDIIRYVTFIGYLTGCLILVAAIIGFLRMQIQLAWLRSREISLRIVNGASRMSLFILLTIEIAIVLAVAVAVAVVLGNLLQDFLDEDMFVVLDSWDLIINDLWPYCLVISGGLLVVCSLIAWIIIHRITRSRNGLSVYMRGGRNHLFRNVMLGIQILICLVFVCSSFILTDAGYKKILNGNLRPDNDRYLREILYFRGANGMTKIQNDDLLDEIKKLPDLDFMVMYTRANLPIKELEDNPEVVEELRLTFPAIHYAEDTTLLRVLGIDVDWLGVDAPREECVLVQKDRYAELKRSGILENNSLRIHGWRGSSKTLPIAGTFDRIPYESHSNVYIAISRELDQGLPEHLLIPKHGKAKSLERNVNETAERLMPEVISKTVHNYRSQSNPILDIIECAVTVGWILGCVSLLICVMGIFSTITLDTRARKKEVAIRKVNGAKRGDIYRMFGKVYAWLILLSLLIAVPVSVLFGKMINALLIEIDPAITSSFVGPIFLGCLVVVIFILSIVFWQIRRVMQVDPAKIIAKE